MKGLVALAVALVAFMASAAAPTDAHAFKRCAGLMASVKGTPGNDVIRGTSALDVISAGRGDDRIEGFGAGDFLCGGPGNDTLDGGEGADRLQGGAGDDVLAGGGGGDVVRGQGGEDTGAGDDGIDACFVDEPVDCEADLTSFINSYFAYERIAGDATVDSFEVGVHLIGPSAVNRSYVELYLPPEARFVPESSDVRCRSDTPGAVLCAGGFIEPVFSSSASFIRFAIAVTYPDCPPEGGTAVTFLTRAADLYTVDPTPQNDMALRSAMLRPAPSCP